MRSIEIQANTAQEATELALAQLGKTIDEVEVEILKPGSHGILGFGGEEALVRVTIKAPEQEAEAGSGPAEMVPESELPLISKRVLETILQAMSIRAKVKVRPPDEMDLDGSDGLCTVCLEVNGDGLGVLIGKHGETLAALQYILNLIVSKKARARTRIVVDVEGYRRRRRDSLVGMARRVAEQVRHSGEPTALEALPAYERRIIHIALRDDPSVTTQSTGEGEQRRVVVMPRG